MEHANRWLPRQRPHQINTLRVKMVIEAPMRSGLTVLLAVGSHSASSNSIFFPGSADLVNRFCPPAV